MKCIKHRQFGLAAIPSFYVFNTCSMLTTLFIEGTSGAGIQLLRTLEQKLQYQDFYNQAEQRQRQLQTQILSPKFGKKKRRQSD